MLTCLSAPKMALLSWLHPERQDGFRVVQGSGWYLGDDLAGHTSPKAAVPGLNRSQAHEYCVQGPTDWMKFYAQDPVKNSTGATEAQIKEFLLGGEASAWGDCISAESFEGMVWPAASAVAERLWSPMEVTDPVDAFPRLAAFRCSMVRRGVRVSPLHPGSCWAIREID